MNWRKSNRSYIKPKIKYASKQITYKKFRHVNWVKAYLNQIRKHI